MLKRKDNSSFRRSVGSWPGSEAERFYYSPLSYQLHSLLWDMWAFGTWPRRNILRMLKLQIRGSAGKCLLPCLGHLQETEPRPSFPALSLHRSPFALDRTLSHAVTDLGEWEGDKSHDIIVPTFPLWKPK